MTDEAIEALLQSYFARGERLMAAAYLIDRLDAAYRGKRVTDLDEAWAAYKSTSVAAQSSPPQSTHEALVRAELALERERE